jgi:hypothetical protein
VHDLNLMSSKNQFLHHYFHFYPSQTLPLLPKRSSQFY